jgi:hypothetical protein
MKTRRAGARAARSPCSLELFREQNPLALRLLDKHGRQLGWIVRCRRRRRHRAGVAPVACTLAVAITAISFSAAAPSAARPPAPVCPLRAHAKCEDSHATDRRGALTALRCAVGAARSRGHHCRGKSLHWARQPQRRRLIPGLELASVAVTACGCLWVASCAMETDGPRSAD